MKFLKLNAMCVMMIALLFCPGCAPMPNIQAQLGYSESRRFVVVGENVEASLARYYQRKYECPVWFTPYRGGFSNATTNFLESGIGPSRAMRLLIKELKSINDTVGRWEIIIPKIAEKYFFNALKSMPKSALSKARGMVVLIDSSGFPDMEREVERVSDGSFFVTYEFQKR